MPPPTRDVLLLDGFGACVSAPILGLVLPAVQERIGMPTPVLHILAVIATLLAATSFTGYGVAGERSARWLRVTMVANVVYCVLTSALVAIHLQEVRPLGVAYFVAEVVVILGLVAFEARALRAANRMAQPPSPVGVQGRP